MKVLITAEGMDLESNVDPRFGRAKYFLVLNTETKHLAIHDNTPNLTAARGAGIQAGQRVADFGVDAVITGNVGPKAFATLQAANVTVYTGATGNVRDALAALEAGTLPRASEANVEGHWT